MPDQPLTIVAPGEESGTYESFIDLVGTADFAVERGVAEDIAGALGPTTSSSDDNVIIENVAGTEGGLGFVGFAFAENAGDSDQGVRGRRRRWMRGVGAGDGDRRQLPARPVALHLRQPGQARGEAALQPFVDFYLTDDGIASVEEVGYISLPEDRKQATRDAWESAMA